MKNWLLFTISGLVAVLCGGGCSSIPPEEPSREVATEKSTPGENLTAAFVRNDADAFRSELPVELQKEFPAERFHATRKTLEQSLGTPVSFRYLSRIEHPLVSVDVWLIRFERTVEDGKCIRQEALFRVISGILDEKPIIISFNFI